jgi:polyhydroxyalkanoate synthesis regulator phasin
MAARRSDILVRIKNLEAALQKAERLQDQTEIRATRAKLVELNRQLDRLEQELDDA